MNSAPALSDDQSINAVDHRPNVPWKENFDLLNCFLTIIQINNAHIETNEIMKTWQNICVLLSSNPLFSSYKVGQGPALYKKFGSLIQSAKVVLSNKSFLSSLDPSSSEYLYFSKISTMTDEIEKKLSEKNNPRKLLLNKWINKSEAPNGVDDSDDTLQTSNANAGSHIPTAESGNEDELIIGSAESTPPVSKKHKKSHSHIKQEQDINTHQVVKTESDSHERIMLKQKKLEIKACKLQIESDKIRNESERLKLEAEKTKQITLLLEMMQSQRNNNTNNSTNGNNS